MFFYFSKLPTDVGEILPTAYLSIKESTTVGEQVTQFKNPRYDSAKAVTKNLIIEGNDAVKDGYFPAIKQSSNRFTQD